MHAWWTLEHKVSDPLKQKHIKSSSISHNPHKAGIIWKSYKYKAMPEPKLIRQFDHPPQPCPGSTRKSSASACCNSGVTSKLLQRLVFVCVRRCMCLDNRRTRRCFERWSLVIHGGMQRWSKSGATCSTTKDYSSPKPGRAQWMTLTRNFEKAFLDCN